MLLASYLRELSQKNKPEASICRQLFTSLYGGYKYMIYFPYSFFSSFLVFCYRYVMFLSIFPFFRFKGRILSYSILL